MNEKKRYSFIEKAIIFVSLASIIAGISLGYPSITGNIVKENSGRYIGAGVSLFILGIIGVFIVSKK